MKKSLVYFLLIFILSFFFAGCTQLKQSQKTSESQTVQKNKAGEESDLSASYHYLESRIHIKDKNYQKAIASLKKALAKDPNSFVITRDLVRLYLRQKNDKKALELAEKLVRQSPDNVDGLLLLVQLKKNSIKEEKLVKILNRILVLDPKNKETFLRLGKIYMEKKNHSEARILFSKMIELFPDYYVAWFYLGEVSWAEKQYELAKIQFLKTIELEPDLIEPRFQLIRIYSMKNNSNNKKKTLEIYKEILEIEPNNHRALLGMALYYFKNNMKAKAAGLFTKLGRDVDSNSRLVMVAV
ncbi:MAG: tetratricopeptide repeat protein, partial [Desulfobacula sp.]|nr:tetratricopeptide repeat protein [Desulfobacula sp.]